MRIPWRTLVITGLLAGMVSACTTRGSERERERERERESGHQREDEAFTVRTADDWGDAAGRVVNHLVANGLQ